MFRDHREALRTGQSPDVFKGMLDYADRHRRGNWVRWWHVRESKVVHNRLKCQGLKGKNSHAQVTLVWERSGQAPPMPVCGHCARENRRETAKVLVASPLWQRIKAEVESLPTVK